MIKNLKNKKVKNKEVIKNFLGLKEDFVTNSTVNNILIVNISKIFFLK